MASIGEFGPSSAEASRATSAATSLMRSRSKAFSTRSDAQVSSASRFIAARSRASRSRSSVVRPSSDCNWAFSALSFSARRTGAAVELGDGGAQVVFGLARGHFDFAAHLIELEFALVEQPRLFAEAVFQILGAAAENFGFRGLRHQLLFEFGDAAAEILDPAALFGQFLGGGLSSTRSASRRSSTVLSSLPASVSRSFSASTWVLSATISIFWESARRRALVERADQLGELGFLVGQRALGVVHDAGLGRDFFLGGAQLIAQRLVARFQRENGGGLFARARS